MTSTQHGVSALAFLTPAGAGVRSPLAHIAESSGAAVHAHDGWEIATSYAPTEDERGALGKSVVWCDVSHIPKFEVWGGLKLNLGFANFVDDAWHCPISRTRGLVLGHCRSAKTGIDVTTQYVAVRIAGPLGRDLIARFCSLDLRPSTAPAGAFRPGSVARTPGFVLCEKVDSYLLLTGAAYAEYLWAVIADAGEPLGGRPVGLQCFAGEEPDA